MRKIGSVNSLKVDMNFMLTLSIVLGIFNIRSVSETGAVSVIRCKTVSSDREQIFLTDPIE
jgi:hypothetical protein